MFNKLFKRKQAVAQVNHTVHHLDQGYLFDYDLKTWEVKAVYEYDWGEEHITREYKVSDGQQTRYLSVEDNDELHLMWSEKVNLRAIQQDLAEYIIKHEAPPERLVYQDKTFFLDEESAGYFKDLATTVDNWAEFMAWDYEDEKGDYGITIERWDEREFEAAHGKFLEEYEISNILPRDNQN